MKAKLLILSSLIVLFSCEQSDFKEDFGCFTDSRDQHSYSYTRLGDQIWMAENLNYLPSVKGPGYGSREEARYYVYGYDGTTVDVAIESTNYQSFGVLYNWIAAREACPPGWHLPSNDEWKELERFIGMSESDILKTGYRYSGNPGEKLKARDFWNAGIVYDDTYHFAAIPGGFRFFDGSFQDLNHSCYFWTSSSYGDYTAWYRRLTLSSEAMVSYDGDKVNGMTVRCLKDE